MLNATHDLTLPTTVTGSWPRPSWFTEVLRGRLFKEALGDSRLREQYLDAVSCVVKELEQAGLVLYEIMEAYQPAIAGERLRGGPLQYAAPFERISRSGGTYS